MALLGCNSAAYDHCSRCMPYLFEAGEEEEG